MRMQTLTLLSACALALAAAGETWTLKSDGTNKLGLNTVTWTASDGVTTSTAINPDDDYVTAGTIYISSSGASLNVFNGHSLTIGTLGEGTGKRRRLYDYGGHTGAYFENEGLILANGDLLQHYFNNEHKMYGKITVTASAEVPFIIHNNFNHTVGYMSFYGPLCGSGHLLVRTGDSGSNAKFYTLFLKGTASGFTGGIELESRYDKAGTLCQSALSLPYGDMPATVTVGTNSVLTAPAATNVCTLKALSLADRAELRVLVDLRTDADEPYLTNSIVRVTDSFTVSDRPRLLITYPAAAAGHPASALPLLTVPDTCVLDPAAFDLVTEGPVAAQPTLSVVTDLVAHVQTLVASRPAVVTLLTGDKSSYVQSDDDTLKAITNAAAWSDGAVPHEDAYYCFDRKVLRTERLGSDTYRLKGLGWTLGTEATLCLLSKTVDMEHLDVLAGSGIAYVFCQFSYSPVYLTCGVNVMSGTLNLRPYARGHLVLNGEIEGGGHIVCSGNHNGSSNKGGYVGLTGVNTNFSGRFTVTMGVNGAYCPGFRHPENGGYQMFSGLYVSDGRCLGGAMDPADPKGIVIENFSQLLITNDVTFAEPTRGMYVGWVGRFNVASGKTMTLRSPLAVNGCIYKENSGCLALGSETVTFGADGAAATPDAFPTNHTLYVVGGTVKPLTAGCLDGIDVVISNDTSFVFDLSPADAGLRAQGVRNVKALTPFACAADTATFKVSFEGQMPDASVFTNGLFTVESGADADALHDILEVERPLGTGYRMKLVEIPDAQAGTMTFAAEFRAAGTRIHLR